MSEYTALILLGVSGVAATFAGFSGVVAAFDRRAHGDWHPEERFRLFNMVLISLGTCLLAFVPLAEQQLRFSEAAMWAIASILMGVFCTVYVLCATPYRRHIGRSRPGSLPLWSTLIFILSLCAAAILQVLNAGAIFVERGAGPYVAGLLLLLVAAALQFAYLVLEPVSPASSDEHSA